MHEQLSQWWEGISLRSKITGVTVLVVTFGLLVVGTGTLTTLQRTLVDEVDRQIGQAATELRELLSSEDGDRAQFTTDQFDEFTTLTPSVFSAPFYFGAVDARGEVIDDNVADYARDSAPDLSRLTASFVADLDGGVTLTSENRTTQWRVATYTLLVTNIDTGEQQQATLVVGANLSDTNNVIGSFASIFLGFGLVVVIMSAAITRLLVTTTFRPLREVEATAARFAGGDFSQRLSGATPNTEVGRLNRSLNTMLSRIDRAFADRAETISRMRRFVGDASHELRTPLVSLRGYAELYRMGAIQKEEDVAQAMERIEKEAMRMSSLVSDLLELARLDEQRPLEKVPVDLVPLARDAALDAMAGSPDRSVTVVVDDRPASTALPTAIETDDASGSPSAPRRRASAALARLRSRRRTASTAAAPELVGRLSLPELPPVSAVVAGDENKLRQVVTNLIGNALRFTPDGSPIELVVAVDDAAGMATLAVVDHGEGIPAQLKEKIFDRFFRADSSRTRDTGGSGLGLAIVSSIVANHGGRIDVLDTPGGGATFRVALPLLPNERTATEAPLYEV
ncbi:two-component system OmpR family sensor kinase [Microcella alkaliphila]|uniref:histidine kinase n=1 Tax=Microcella alkaliphila TaxID=279828 RepID=A0A4Q7TD08_9MICO|nr:HAMP domain-containing sensor histidine kinase [Microcella alkaliphila]RZT58285.1 two-component system OmpR family sensor kinase [Microcella alkaliphila]